MSIERELARLVRAKMEIQEAIEDQGVDVPDNDRIDDYDDYVRLIQTGPASVEWGDITGDLTDQEDLALALGDKYEKPADGIPASDLEEGVIPDVSGFITSSVDDLINYYLKDDTYSKDEVNALIETISQFHYEVYASTSAVDDPQENVLYLIGPTGDGADKYEEYVYSNSTWVKIGDTSIDLSGYVTTTDLSTALEDYTDTTDLSLLLGDKADKDTDAVEGNFAAFNSSGNPVDSGHKHSDYLTSHQDISGKADKVASATSGNFAGLDANGNLTDSGSKASDFATAAQGAKADTAYQKPSNGIPASDLASGVIPSVPVTDVTVGGTSVVSNGTAAIPAIPSVPVQDVTVGGTSVVSSGTAAIPAIPDAVEANPTVPSGTTPATLQNVKVGNNYYSVPQGSSVPLSTDVAADKNDNTKASTPKSVYDAINPACTIDTTTASVSVALAPNKTYKYLLSTGVTSLAFTLATPADAAIDNIYRIKFKSGSTPTSVTWPSGVLYANGEVPTIEADCTYEVTIEDNCLVCIKYEEVTA